MSNNRCVGPTAKISPRHNTTFRGSEFLMRSLRSIIPKRDFQIRKNIFVYIFFSRILAP